MRGNISIRYGILASLIFIIWVMAEHALGLNTTRLGWGEKARMASAFVFYFFIVLCIRVRKRKGEGGMTFADGMRTGALMVVVYGALTALCLAIYQHFINPDMLQLMLQYTEQKLRSENASPEEIIKAVEEVNMVYSGKASSYIFYFIFSSAIGCIVALIASFIFKTRTKE